MEERAACSIQQGKHAQDITTAQESFSMQIAAYSTREDARQRSLAEARALFERQVAETHQKVAAQHAEIDNFQRELSAAIAQITLRTLYEIFKADRPGHVDIIVFNGYVASTDKRTGHPSRTCLITVRTSRDTFTPLNLSKVDPPHVERLSIEKPRRTGTGTARSRVQHG